MEQTAGPRPGTEAGTRPLWRDRDFSVFWGAQTLSVAGDSFALIAVPLLVLNVTGSVAQMGLLTGVAGAASVVAGIFAGVLVDRFDRRKLLIGCDLIRLVLYAVVPLAWMLGPQIWLLFVVLPVAEAVGMVFQVTYVTAVRALAGQERVTEANGRLYATAAAAGILGPVLAGVVAGAFGLTAAIAINAASFAVSAIGVRLIGAERFAPEPAETAPPAAPVPSGEAEASPPAGTAAPAGEALAGEALAGTAEQGKPWQELVAGAVFLWRHPVLRVLTILLSFFVFLTLGLTDIVIFRLKHDLGRPDSTIGWVLGVAAVGTVLGSTVVARLRRGLGFGPVWIGALTAAGLAILCLAFVGTVWGVAATMACYLACTSIAGICSMSLRQQVTPSRLLGRVTSAFWTIHFSLGPVGAAVLSWGAARYGATAVFLFAGACCLLIAVVALFTPVRGRRPEAA